MKNKIKSLLLVSALLLSPISNSTLSYAKEEPVKQEVIQKAGENYSVEYDDKDGAIVLTDDNSNENKDQKDDKSNKNNDVKDLGEAEVKIEKNNEKDTKNKEDKENKDEVKVEETKDTSKKVYDEMKIVDKKDDDQNVNFITVVSKNSNNEPLTGFKYKLINKDTNKELELDFTSKTELIAKVPDGNYLIKFVSGPEKYNAEEDISLTMPMKDEKSKKNEYTRQTKVMLKHTLKKEDVKKVTSNPLTMDDKNVIVSVLLAVALIAVIVYLIKNYDKNKKNTKNKEDKINK